MRSTYKPATGGKESASYFHLVNKEMSKHPLEISGGSSRPKFLQPRFPQIGPAGDGPRVILCAQSGMGKTTAAVVLLKEYLRIVDRVYIISSTIDLDPAYAEMKKMVEKTVSYTHLTLPTNREV